jgi:CubicO group peptidase (beta-lactamase class C family)
MIHKCFFLIFGFLILTIPGLSQSQKPWKTSSPEEQGMNSLTFVNAIKHFRQDSFNIHRLLIIRNNHIVVDVSFYPFKDIYVHDLASVTKSITSLLIGIAIDKNLIKGDDEPILNYFPEYKIKNDTLEAVTIRDLLNMSSGFQCSWNNGEKELTQMRKTNDWVKFMLTLPFSADPDKQFAYCSGNYYLLAEILQRATKMTCHQFAEKYLFKPLSFGKSYWLTNYKGVNMGWGDLHISIYDMAKIGCLVMNDGKWNGRQIISKQWLEKIQPLHPIQGTESYGYGWWLDSENPDEVQAVGRGGQRLFVFKSRNMVIATMGGGGYEAGDIDNIALEAIKTFNKNENNYNLLLEQIKGVEQPNPPIAHVKELPVNALNKTFAFGQNDLGLSGLRFERHGADDYIILKFADNSREEHQIGMNNQYRISYENDFGLPMAVKAKWINDTLLQIDYNRLTRIEDYKLRISFGGDSIDLSVTEASKNINEHFNGKIESPQ